MSNLISEKIHYERLKNGFDIYSVNSDLDDIVILKMALPGGIHAAYQKQSLMLLLSDLLPAGIKKTSRNKVLEKIENLGARVNVSFGSDYLFINIVSLTSVFSDVLKMVVSSVVNPVISEDDYNTSLEKIKNILKQNENDTKIVSSKELIRLMYKKGHPHYRKNVKELERELGTLKLNDMIEFHKKTLTSVGAFAVVAGGTQNEKIKKDITKTLALFSEKISENSFKFDIKKLNDDSKKDARINIKDKLNVDTRLGIPLFITNTHSDFYALQFAVSVLGSSSTSRLFNVLRTQKNLTYGAYASLESFEKGYPGFLSAYSIFPNTVWKEGKEAMFSVIENFVNKGIKKKEFEEMKEEVRGKFKVGLSSSAGLSGAVFSVVLNGRPVSFIDEYVGVIDSLALKQVNASIKEHLDLSLLKTASAGTIDGIE